MQRLLLHTIAGLLCMLSYITTFCQDKWPAPYEIKADTGNFIYFEYNNWQVLPDRTGQLTLEQVMAQPFSDSFIYFPSLRQDSANPVNTFWFRFRVKNVMPSMARVGFGTSAEVADFYVDSSGKSIHYKTGWKKRASKKDGLKVINFIPLELSPGATLTVYYRRHDKEMLSPELRLSLSGSYAVMKQQLTDYETKYYSGDFSISPFFVGFFLLAAIFNFFLYLVVREKVYLYFSLFLFLFWFGDNGIVTDVVFDGSLVVYHILYRIVIPVFFFFVQFVRYYFKTFLVVPKWDKWVRLVGYSLCGYYILYLSLGIQFESIDNYLSIYLFGITFITLIITLFKVVKKSGRDGRFFLLAIAPFLFTLAAFFIVFLSGEFLSAIDEADAISFSISVERWSENVGGLAVAWAVVVFSWALFNRYNAQRKEIAHQALETERLAKEKEMERNALIAKQKVDLEREVEDRTKDLKHSLENLKAAQTQLIHAEKMASLGQLTAGIAHEIQNPLNFVNNFSDVNKDLLAEMKEEIIKGNTEEVKLIADDIIANEAKINHHGKRADSIVKGMLQHSRSGGGQKELTDINALADEYLKLAYHGQRAKDAQHSANKFFSPGLKTAFDNNIGRIHIVPQDIGRVLINLYNNAFYAVNEKNTQSSANNIPYEPTVSVTTAKVNGVVEIKVTDNGNGIPQHITDKIFQPFFTTKPTGQGTGLGLSLTYDIIKAHNGEIKVDTREGEYTSFTITLPATTPL